MSRKTTDTRNMNPPNDSHSPNSGSSGSSGAWLGYLIGPLFLALALFFWLASAEEHVPLNPPVPFNKASLTTAPRRQILSDPPRIHLGGFERTCMECHRMFPSMREPEKNRLRHSNINLRHGINTTCESCHHDEDRNKLALRNGTLIGYNDVVDLCAQCHSNIYRDWRRGAHGRTNLHWNAERGEVKRLVCTECHDPHEPRVPAMDPLVPLPGPNTLRTPGKSIDHEAHQEHETGVKDPLRIRESGEANSDSSH